ncbi:MAG: hemin uptake protein HemP [Pirellulaceae bacterium]|nr:hemin uptake protein HemP [Pirellulaceae bacterium]
MNALSAETAAQLPKIVSFDTLSRCGDEIWIENNGQIYRLRRTKQGKLILTK